jgi:hypothetical protein
MSPTPALPKYPRVRSEYLGREKTCYNIFNGRGNLPKN